MPGVRSLALSGACSLFGAVQNYLEQLTLFIALLEPASTTYFCSLSAAFRNIKDLLRR